ncbi:5,10-methylenetetrahydrofolate reductase [Candidatus Uzinura diaspidicola str. ASNER]|uniref:Methylenetetrahydrofolate reductase n=1 Tax=Candidatus Uzinura diaspidicola str. ASNER TaxID=1133592 RepID=L7VMT9_9FLAO|nr:5,10-methylenetetrahydrofolate reductase [Candidatus Uzinura diaspidicola str. ASNER]
MKITSHIANIKKTIYSFEILPPLRDHNILEIFNTLYTLIEFNPPFVNVTSHRDNEVQKRLRRTGTVSICGAIMSKYEIDAIPHFLCRGFTKQMTEDALIELNFLGVYNILIIRGDMMKFTTETSAHSYSIELVKQVVALNNGIYLDEALKNRHASDFCIGIACYPEKHFEAPNIEEDIFRLSEKIKAGSYFVMTQMFFDNNQYFEYIEIMRFAGLEVPIIPGIKPISSIDQLKSIPSNFYVNIPTKLVKKIINYKKDIFYIGIKWALNQSIELKEAGIPIIHYYTMNKPDNIYQIVIELI